MSLPTPVPHPTPELSTSISSLLALIQFQFHSFKFLLTFYFPPSSLEHQNYRETTAEHNLHVLAMDSGEPSLTSTATIIVTVADINDAYPKLLKNYHPKVRQTLQGDPPQLWKSIYIFLGYGA